MAGYSWKGMNNNIIKEIVLSGFGFACVTGDVLVMRCLTVSQDSS